MVAVTEIDDRIAKCNKILDENPNSQIFAALAEAYRKKGQLDQAFRICQSGLRIHPNYGSAHMVMARINIDKGMYDWAEIEAKKIIELEGESHASDLLLAEIYVNRGEFGRATKLLDKLYKIDPQNSQVVRLLEMARKIPMEAAQEMSPAVDGSPTPEEKPPGPAEQPKAEKPDKSIREEPASDESSQSVTIPQMMDALANIGGVDGVLLINSEGLVAESRWSDEKEPDLYGALARDIEKTIQDQLDTSIFGEYESVLIEAEGLILNFLPLKDSMFLIKANGRINLGTLRLKLVSLLNRLDKNY